LIRLVSKFQIKEHDLPMAEKDIPHEYYGWWRIIETSQWTDEDIDIIGTALISLTGYDDRLRMFVLLTHVSCKSTKTGVSFTWQVHGRGLGSTILFPEPEA
jgi:hypothetical protein